MKSGRKHTASPYSHGLIVGILTIWHSEDRASWYNLTCLEQWYN